MAIYVRLVGIVRVALVTAVPALQGMESTMTDTPAIDSTTSVSRRSRAAVVLDRLAGYIEIKDREAAIVVICEELERAETYFQIEYLLQHQRENT